jgi:hypothetical protein
MTKIYLSPIDDLDFGKIYLTKGNHETLFWYLKDSKYRVGLVCNETNEEMHSHISITGFDDELSNLVIWAPESKGKLFTEDLMPSRAKRIFLLIVDEYKWMTKLYKSPPSDKYLALDLTKVDYTKDPLIAPRFSRFSKETQKDILQEFGNNPKRLLNVVSQKSPWIEENNTLDDLLKVNIIALANCDYSAIHRLTEMSTNDLNRCYLTPYPRLASVLKSALKLGDLLVFYSMALNKFSSNTSSDEFYTFRNSTSVKTFLKMFWLWTIQSSAIYNSPLSSGVPRNGLYQSNTRYSQLYFQPSIKAINQFQEIFN